MQILQGRHVQVSFSLSTIFVKIISWLLPGHVDVEFCHTSDFSFWKVNS